MQLGLTIQLQKHLKIKSTSYGEPSDLFFCWELHFIRFQGKNALAAVNANNRFLVLMVGMKAAGWKLLPKRFEEAVTSGFLSEGYSKDQIDVYFNLAGDPLLTKMSNPEHFTPPVRVLETDVPEKRKPRFR